MRSESVDRDYKSLVPKVLERLFPRTTEREEARLILSRYQECESDRVQLGILKASNGDLQKMKQLTDIATSDWRDLLCIAEYPLSSKKWGLREKDPKRYEQLLEKEQAEYDRWLRDVLAT